MKEFYDSRKTDVQIVDDRLMAICRHASRLQPEAVLDLASGRGALLHLLQTLLPDSRITGADISASSVAACRARGFEAHAVDVSQELTFPTDSFDLVVFGEIIEHIVDPDFALAEIARVLKIGGHVIITTPNLASWFNRILLLAGIQPIFTETSLHVNLGRKLKALGQWRSTQGHLKIFTLGALREMLQANGYIVERIEGAPFYLETPLKPLDRFLARIPVLASNLILVARNTGQRTTSYPEYYKAHD